MAGNDNWKNTRLNRQHLGEPHPSHSEVNYSNTSTGDSVGGNTYNVVLSHRLSFSARPIASTLFQVQRGKHTVELKHRRARSKYLPKPDINYCTVLISPAICRTTEGVCMLLYDRQKTDPVSVSSKPVPRSPAPFSPLQSLLLTKYSAKWLRRSNSSYLF